VEIRLSIQSAVIIFLAVCVLVMGSFFYRGYDLLSLTKEKRERESFIQETQKRLLMLQVEPQVSKLFTDLGYKMNVMQPPLPFEKKETPK